MFIAVQSRKIVSGNLYNHGDFKILEEYFVNGKNTVLCSQALEPCIESKAFLISSKGKTHRKEAHNEE